MEIFYFIFGSHPANIYHDEGFKPKAIAKAIKHDGQLYCHNTNYEGPASLLLAYDGWQGFAEISEKEYLELKALLDSET